MGSSSTVWPTHISGLWHGQATPDASIQDSTPVNPICWSLALVPTSSGPSVFGAGFFDDAGDIEGTPVLMFTLEGKWDASGKVELTKRYTNRNIPEELCVEYIGELHREPENNISLKGRWSNAVEGTFGVFAALLEPPAAEIETKAAGHAPQNSPSPRAGGETTTGAPAKFIDTAFTTKAEYEQWCATLAAAPCSGTVEDLTEMLTDAALSDVPTQTASSATPPPPLPVENMLACINGFDHSSLRPAHTTEKTVNDVLNLGTVNEKESIPASVGRGDVPPGPPPTPTLADFSSRLEAASNVIVMLGAGASVSAGIPDFRSPGTGLYDNLAKYNLPRPEAVFDIDFFRSNPMPFYQLARELWPDSYAPTAVHHFVTLLHQKGKLLRCYSQNIDSLESSAGLPPSKLVAAHGNFDSAHVIDGGMAVPIAEVKDAVFADDPAAAVASLQAKYGGLVKPDITFFHEALPPRFGELAPDDFEACDLVIIIGTSLKVNPFCLLPTFVNPGTPRLLINRELVGPFVESCASLDGTDGATGRDLSKKEANDVALLGNADDGVTELARLVGWQDDLKALVAGNGS